MRKRSRLIASVFIAAAIPIFYPSYLEARQDRPGAPTAPRIFDARQLVLESGLHVYLIEDHSRPTIDMVARVASGSLHDPEGKEGISHLLGGTLRSGGSSTITAAEIDEMLFGLDGSFRVDVQPTATTLKVSVPKAGLDLALSIIADVLMYPAFPTDEIQQNRHDLIARYRGAESDPRFVGLRELMRQAYGPGSPYSRVPTESALASITRTDLVNFHRRNYHPRSTSLGVWGAFDQDDIVELVEMGFEGWDTPRVPARPLPDVPLRLDSTLTVIHKPDARESIVLVGHLLPAAASPDYAPLRIAATMLTHRSAGRVTRLLRRDVTGAREVFGDFVLPRRHPGMLYAGAVVSPQRTLQAISALKLEFGRLAETVPSEDEVVSIRSAIAQNMRRDMRSRAFMLEQLMAVDYFGLPRDHFHKSLSAIEMATPADVQRAARRHIHPQRLHIVIIGNEAALRETLSKLGPVRTIDLQGNRR